MKLFKASEALLHRSQSPLLLSRRVSAMSCHYCNPRPQPFTTTRQARAEDKASWDISRLLDDSLGPLAAPQRSSNTTNNRGYLYSPSSPPRVRQSPAGSTTDDLLDAMKSILPRQTQPRPTSSLTTGGGKISDYLDPLSNTTQPSTSLMGYGSSSTTPEAKPLPIKLGPSIGRTIIVDGRKMDVGRAFRSLEIQCARNAVRKDAMRQRFHERPGLKRKRLKSERWRRRFREGFRAVVARVQVMQKQGW